ncbi:hypothetical protein LCN94_01525 [Ruminococcus sp. FMB-CY1]|uniref:hypothetical protein n=1 Tax=Ruminococcus sp. FMB-CY1 TaxID=2878202 RepID=UPI0022F37C6B|nr:hypothetical protein [Ruminococcus sp. FMB-CY1]WBX57815.1 hypothetical protein LCN94_01525 [Ruminococcus sp. FMB-CY1]
MQGGERNGGQEYESNLPIFLQKREFKKLEKGEALQIPQGYYLVRDEMWINDFTGASYHFVFMQLTATRRLTNNESKTNQRNE